MSASTVQEIRIADFDYDLPEDRIAKHPVPERDTCRLILCEPDGTIKHKRFYELPELLPRDTAIFCNDTRVINARISFRKPTGSKIEVFLLEPVSPNDYVLMFQSRESCIWNCLVGNLKRWKEPELEKRITVEGKEVILTARYIAPSQGSGHVIEFKWSEPDITFASVVEAAGFIPIPPYLKRESEETDSFDYQTVFAKYKGSVAAPTAGLHFSPAVIGKIRDAGIDIYPLTLHVGAGTFQPVKSETIGEHPMHTETFSITASLIDALIDLKKGKHPVTAVGTTTVRTLESLPYLGAAIREYGEPRLVMQWWPYTDAGPRIKDTLTELETIRNYMRARKINTLTGATSIMIAPGFDWRITDIIITNFHQPQSTLLLLVSSFLEPRRLPGVEARPVWRKIYDEALSLDYRFLSYGDACLLYPQQ